MCKDHYHKNGHLKSTSKKIKLTNTQSLANIPNNTPWSSTTYPKSFDLLRAGRMVRPTEEIEAVLEFFDICKKQ